MLWTVNGMRITMPKDHNAVKRHDAAVVQRLMQAVTVPRKQRITINVPPKTKH